jgi:hypothetical protein
MDGQSEPEHALPPSAGLAPLAAERPASFVMGPLSRRAIAVARFLRRIAMAIERGELTDKMLGL